MVVTIFTTIMGPMMTSSLAALVTRSFTVLITTATILTGITRTDIILTDIIRTATATAAMDTVAMDTGDTDMDTILTISPVTVAPGTGELPRFGELRCVWHVQAITAESWVLERVMQPDLTSVRTVRA
jgi:hypothetical protein